METCFIEEIKKSDQLEIAVGFSSCNTLRKLDELITQQKIKNVSLILGMYYFDGISKALFNLALKINDK
ncbi:NgoFVII family restriction endonuclease [Microbacterium esteraromaticum]|nr:NgoFVII family restriction endonuclease [Microbacterium esteraromaticum]